MAAYSPPKAPACSLLSPLSQKDTPSPLCSPLRHLATISPSQTSMPPRTHGSIIFLEDLEELAPHISSPWLLLGISTSFELQRTKTPPPLSHPNLCSTFNDTINRLGFDELPLLDRHYTWSNKINPPTLARFNRMFINLDLISSTPSYPFHAQPRIILL